MATVIVYASSTGNTQSAAEDISKQLGGIKVVDIADDGLDIINDNDKIIIGNSTWGEGELQDDWEDLWADFCDIDFSGKTVALFGLGDQDGYADEYLDAMGIIHEQVIKKGALVVGQWENSDEYEFDESKALKDGKFVGLALDEDNQSDLTQDRINKWCEQIKADIL